MKDRAFVIPDSSAYYVVADDMQRKIRQFGDMRPLYFEYLSLNHPCEEKLALIIKKAAELFHYQTNSPLLLQSSNQ